MTPLHVLINAPKDWLDWLSPWLSLIAALIAAGLAYWISKRQNDLTSKQIEILATQALQQKQQLKQDLFDRRYEVFAAALMFIRYAAGGHGDFPLTAPEHRRFLDAQGESTHALRRGCCTVSRRDL